MGEAVRLTARKAGFVFIRADHIAVGLNASLAIHRERIRVGPRRKVGGINRKRLILELQIEIRVKIAAIDRRGRFLVSAVLFQLEIPPPLFRVIYTAIAKRIVELGQDRRSFGHVHRRPTERLFLKDPLKVPRTGFHATPTHCATLCGNAVCRAFDAIGFPNFIAVEHPLRPGSDRTRGAFARTFIAAFAEVLQAEVDGFVVCQRHICGDCA